MFDICAYCVFTLYDRIEGRWQDVQINGIITNVIITMASYEVSEETHIFFHYCSEIVGPNFVSFRCYELKVDNFHKRALSLPHAKFPVFKWAQQYTFFATGIQTTGVVFTQNLDLGCFDDGPQCRKHHVKNFYTYL